MLAEVGAAVAPGVTTDELDAHRATRRASTRGGYPSPLNYSGYPKSLCTSVNEVICHGIPDDRPLQDGDIVNLDVTLYRDGVHGDTNATFFVGTVDERVARPGARHRGVPASAASRRCGRAGRCRDIGRAIEDHAEGARLRRGAGVHRARHRRACSTATSQVLHYYDARGHAWSCEPGMMFTIEPMITIGDVAAPDVGRRLDRGHRRRPRTAQFEHTLLVTDDGADILTLRPDGQWSGDAGTPTPS